MILSSYLICSEKVSYPYILIVKTNKKVPMKSAPEADFMGIKTSSFIE